MIVGGSFSGLRAQRELSDGFDVTVVDTKEYFEYTPGVLRLYTKPSELRMLTAALPTALDDVVGEVTEVATNARLPRDGRPFTVRLRHHRVWCGLLLRMCGATADDPPPPRLAPGRLGRRRRRARRRAVGGRRRRRPRRRRARGGDHRGVPEEAAHPAHQRRHAVNGRCRRAWRRVPPLTRGEGRQGRDALVCRMFCRRRDGRRHPAQRRHARRSRRSRAARAAVERGFALLVGGNERIGRRAGRCSTSSLRRSSRLRLAEPRLRRRRRDEPAEVHRPQAQHAAELNADVAAENVSHLAKRTAAS